MLIMSVSNRQIADSVPRSLMTMSPKLNSPDLKFRRTETFPLNCGGEASKYIGCEVKIFSRPAPFMIYSVRKYATFCSNVIRGDV